VSLRHLLESRLWMPLITCIFTVYLSCSNVWAKCQCHCNASTVVVRKCKKTSYKNNYSRRTEFKSILIAIKLHEVKKCPFFRRKLFPSPCLFRLEIKRSIDPKIAVSMCVLLCVIVGYRPSIVVKLQAVNCRVISRIVSCQVSDLRTALE